MSTTTTGMNGLGSLDTQLTHLGNSLHTLLVSVSHKSSTLSLPKQDERKAYLSLIASSLETEFLAYQDRKVYIERRKESMEKLQLEKLKEEIRLRDLEEYKRLQDESERLQKEEDKRQEEKLRKQQEKLDVIKLQQKLEAFQIIMDEASLLEMGSLARQQLLMNAQNKAQAAKEEEQRRFIEQGKKKDFLERAFRLESIEKVKVRVAAQAEEDEKLRQELLAKIATEWKTKHDIALEEKKCLTKMQLHRNAFETPFLASQQQVYSIGHKKFLAKKLQEKREEMLSKARAAYFEELERLEREEELEQMRIEKEENERIEREQYERARRQREEEERLEKEHEERQREAIEKMKRQIAEAEAKQKEERERRAAGGPSSSSSAAVEPVAVAPVAAAPAPMEPKKYVPPSARSSGPAAAPYAPPVRAAAGGGGGGWERVGAPRSGGGGGGFDRREDSGGYRREGGRDERSGPPPTRDGPPPSREDKWGSNTRRDDRDRGAAPPSRDSGDNWRRK